MTFSNDPLETPAGSNKSKVIETPKYIQWTTNGTGTYYPEGYVEKVDSIPAGFYSIGYDQKQDKYFVRNTKHVTDNILELPMPETEAILSDVVKFWSNGDKFKEYGLTYKRGILMYGPPGCGKTNIMQLIIKNLIKEQGGVVFSIEKPTDVQYYSNFMQTSFKVIEKTRKIVTIIEDIDGLFQSGKDTETLLLNILDGMNHMDNIVYLATTNYPEELSGRIMNRPSRFDRRYEIGLPNENVRKFYLEHTLLSDDLKNIDINRWVKDTDKMSVAHLRELIVSTVIQGNPYEEVIKILKELNDNVPHSKHFGGGRTVGFGTR